MWKAYLRWRHSKGFGVHSPYAYKFITDVLNPGEYGYYAYEQLEFLSRGLSKGSPALFRNAKFLIRLLIFLHTKRIITGGRKYPEAQVAAKALKITYFNQESKSAVTFKPGDLLILLPDGNVEPSVIEKAIENQVPVLAFNPSSEVREILETPIGNGVLFNGKSKILLIPRAEMQYVSYEIRW